MLRITLRRLLSNPRQRGYPTQGSTIDCLWVRYFMIWACLPWTLQSTSPMRLSPTSGQTCLPISDIWPCQHFRPICLAEIDDLSLDLAERAGAVAGWGVTEVDYAHTQCGYSKGITKPDSISRVLKKLLGLRWLKPQSNILCFISIFTQVSHSGRLL